MCKTSAYPGLENGSILEIERKRSANVKRSKTRKCG